MIEALRGLLLDAPLGSSLPLALGWCVVLIVLGVVWSTRLYERRSVR